MWLRRSSFVLVNVTKFFEDRRIEFPVSSLGTIEKICLGASCHVNLSLLYFQWKK